MKVIHRRTEIFSEGQVSGMIFKYKIFKQLDKFLIQETLIETVINDFYEVIKKDKFLKIKRFSFNLISSKKFTMVFFGQDGLKQHRLRRCHLIHTDLKEFFLN